VFDAAGARDSMTPKHWIDLLIGLAITGLILVGIEVSLGAAGLGEVPDATNWSRGFDPSARYLVPHAEPPGSWQTRFKHKTRPEVTVPPKGELPRILTFGGSNTAGFDTGYMEQVLAKELGSKGFEAFNLGRPGYGSERVKLIFLQALEVLDPDVVILYTGHNEFVERGFEMDLEAASAGGWATVPLRVARDTRLFNAIVQRYSQGGESRQKEPEAWDNEYQKFADITYDQTQEYFRAYKQNVRSMCEAALERGVRVVLCTIVYNRMSVPFSSTFPDDFDPAVVEEFEGLRRTALARLPEYLDVLLPTKEKHRLHAMDFSVRDREREKPAEVLQRNDYEGWRKAKGFLKKRDPMLQNASRWDAKVHRYYDAVLRHQRRDLGDQSRDRVLRAEKQLEQALTLYPEHPRALFELALTKHLVGRSGKSVAALLERAADLDRAPRKGSNMVNEIVRKVASQTEGVVLADIDRAFQECLPNGVVGWEWMADHCHLNRGGRDAITELMAAAVLENWRDLAAGGDLKEGASQGE